MFCKNCGSLMNENERFCAQCGAQNAALEGAVVTQQTYVASPEASPSTFVPNMNTNANTNPRSMKDVILRQFRSPLIFILAACVVLFGVLVIIGQGEAIEKKAELMENLFEGYIDGTEALYYMTEFLCRIFVIVAFLLICIGICVLIFPSEARLRSGTGLVASGAGFLVATTAIYTFLKQYYMMSTAGSMLKNEGPAYFFFVTALGVCSIIYFSNIAGFFGAMKKYATNQSVGAFRVRGRGIGVVSFVVAAVVMMFMLGAENRNTVPYGFNDLFHQFGTPSHMPVLAIITLVSFGVFGIVLAGNTEKALGRRGA